MEVIVDARGLLCPLPLLRARAALASAAPDDVVVVLATDREAPIDLGALALEARRPLKSAWIDDAWRLELAAAEQ